MITLYSGTPGSGKSYHAVSDIYFRTRYGHHQFIINFFVADGPEPAPIYRANRDLTIDFLKQYALEHHQRGAEGQTTVIIDEAGTFFNSRTWREAGRGDWLQFFAEHRHWGYDFILIAQFEEQLDRQIRQCVEVEVRHTSLSNYNFFLSLIFRKQKVFILKKFLYGFGKLRSGFDFMLLRRKVAALYDTHNSFKAAGHQ